MLCDFCQQTNAPPYLHLSMKLILSLIAFLPIIPAAFTQPGFPFRVELKESVHNFPVVHSFAQAIQGNKVVLMCGRLEGIHARQPFRSFSTEYANRHIYLFDIASGRQLKQSFNNLPATIAEQLMSSNTNFFQKENKLYITGGYGYSTLQKDFITFPFLTIVDVNLLIDAMEKGTAFTSAFTQLKDEQFAVTGGHLTAIGDSFYLAGGQKFTGRYNPMGHDTYEQVYHTAIKSFAIKYLNDKPIVAHGITYKDAVNLRRRDFNLLPEIAANGESYLTVSGGVFQPDEDLPYLYPVRFKSSQLMPFTGFDQYLANYHSAVSSLRYGNATQHIFYGGISRFYYENATLMQDDNVPFVKTISLLQSTDSGYTEYKLPVEMPSFLGANAAFVPASGVKLLPNGIVDMNAETSNRFMLGYVAGGILSNRENVFNNNNTEESSASAKMYEVWLTKDSSADALAVNGTNPCRSKLLYIDLEKARLEIESNRERKAKAYIFIKGEFAESINLGNVPACLLYTSPSPRD